MRAFKAFYFVCNLLAVASWFALAGLIGVCIGKFLGMETRP